MPNLTLRVDDETLKKARKIAIDKDTTVTEMIREFLVRLAGLDRTDRERAARALEDSFATHGRSMGPRTWTREDLYES